MPKRMRLPNGFGQISKLNNKRLRNPYRAMVTVGKTPEGRPICKLLKPQAYFPTYNDAYAALLEYNKHPFDVTQTVTFKEMYDKWFEVYSQNKSKSSIRAAKVEYNCCEEVWYMDLREIKPAHIKSCMGKTESPKFKKGVRFLFQEILSMGMEIGAVESNVARDYAPKISQEGKKSVTPHTILSDEELDRLWKDSSDPISRAILIQCYTGLRPDELCKIRKSDVHFEQGYLVGGSKTDAGKNRMVPIVKKIKEIVEEAMKNETEYMVATEYNKPLRYENYYVEMKKRLPNHKPHDPRKTFVTLAKKAGVNEYAIKRIVGHAIEDITENVYTERDIEWLIEEAEKICEGTEQMRSEASGV